MKNRIKVEVNLTVTYKAALAAVEGVAGVKKIDQEIKAVYDFEVEKWESIGRLRLYEQETGLYRFCIYGIIYDPELLRAVITEDGTVTFEIAPQVTLEDLLYDVGY
ncbi:MAG: hypothetical protein KatS3mg031_2851 [Chitinophagales bacterium]|nr:MAG: hypothetical protein KatS3mg031_2851 [Chitinophagales bacterium]